MCHAAEHYGFVLDDNPHDAALLPVGALSDDQLQGSIQPRECWLHPCGTPSWGLLRALRTWAATLCGHGCGYSLLQKCRLVTQKTSYTPKSSQQVTLAGLTRHEPHWQWLRPPVLCNFEALKSIV